ncbi:TPA: phage tail tape measure protein [Clostridioides difficile]|uniref:Tail tape measure protein n=1 Tax=Clostridium phage CDKM15 TaxID=1868595 RepID=A0A3G1E3F4_9CAUD|nr:phage tail tape measure protein [Clostridioides difficile]YP_009830888.1 tail tape measure protein [Clostridium phage CDKM15]ANT45160.1 tail tape measure protein [Clostridium phage CDKM15]EJA6787284.1 phage tail tape measure protein [Clostridioides difficile]MBH6887011.1 phage tail tape measure protein [Clostridioides difficile]MBH7180976.1 phage tail tape measure protein [Clostridioides difficile]MCD8659812.1 phage tail tape measure protein [Clostridioides difficile]
MREIAKKEMYHIDVVIDVTGDEQTKSKLSAMERYMKQTEKRMKALNRIKANPIIQAQDKTSSVVNRISNNLKRVGRTISTTINAKDRASSVVNRVKNKVNSLLTSRQREVLLKARDKASQVVDKVKAKVQNLTAATIISLNMKADPALRVISQTRSKLGELKNNTIINIKAKGEEALNTISRTKSKLQEFSNRTYQAIVKLKDEASPTLSGIGSKIDSFISGAISKFAQLTTAITVALGGIGVGSSIKTFANFEQGMKNVQAVTGASGKEMEALTVKARNLGKTTAYSAREVSDAMYYAGMAGWKTNQIIEGMPGILNLAATGGTDLALTSDIVTDGLTALGMTAKDTGQFVDIMAATITNSNTNVELFGETLKFIGSLGGSLGVPMRDVALATGLMASSAIKGSQAGTSLRMGLLRLINEPKRAATAMRKYGIEMKTTKSGSLDLAATIDELRNKLGKLSDTKKVGALGDIVGANASSGWAAIVNASESDYNKLKKAIAESEEEAKRIADMKMDSLNGQFAKLKNTINDVKISIGEKLGPVTRNFMENIISSMPKVGDSIVNFVSNFINNFDKIKNVLQGVISIIGGVIAGFMAFKALTVISSVISIITKIATASTLIGGIVGVLGPIGAIVLTVGMLAGAFLFAYQKSEIFRNGIKNIGKSISNFLKPLNTFIEQIKSKFKELMNVLKPLFLAVSELGSMIISALSPVIQFLATVFIIKFIYSFNVIVNKVKAIVNTITGVVNGLIEIFKGIADVVKGFINGDGKQVTNGLKSIFKGIIDIVKSLWSGLVDFVTSPIQAVVDILDTKFGKKVEGIKKKWNELKDFLKNPTKSAPKVQPVNLSSEKASSELQTSSNGAKEYISSLGQKIGEGIGKIKEKFGELKTSATEVFNNIVNFIGGKATELKDKLLEGIKPAIDTFKQAFSNLKETFGGSLDSIKEAFGGLKTVFDENIKTPFENLKQKVLEMKESLKPVFDNLKSSFAELGKALEPIKEAFSGVKDFFSNLFKPIKDDGATKTTKTNMDELKQSTQRVGTSFKELGNAFNQLKEAAKPFIDYLKQIKDSLTSTLGDIGGGLLKGVATSIVLVITSVINAIASIIKAVAGAIKGVIDIIKGIFEIIGGIISGDGEKIKQGFSDAFKGIGEVVKSLWEGIKGVLGAPIKAVVDFVSNGFSEKVGQVKQWWADLKTNVAQKISGFVSFISDGFQQKVQQVGMWWQGLKVNLSGKISGFVSLVENGFKSKVDSIKSAWDSLKKKLSTKITGFVSIVKTGVSNILDHFADGGVASKPSICGEAGPEMVIPLSNSKRSRALSLYEQAGQMLGTKASNNVIPISQKLGTSFNSTSSIQNSNSSIINNVRQFPTKQEEFNNTENRIYQEAQPQNIISSGSNAINVGGISINIQGSNNKEEMIQEILSQVESGLREALEDIG